jgi:ABC-type glycerol-3-phosphate transport system substrate-binding protein
MRLLVAAILLVAVLAGCGGGSTIKPASTVDYAQAERDQWNAYTPAAQEEYRQAFTLCSYWLTTSPVKWTVGPTEAAVFFVAHDRFRTALGAGCGDGIANTPLAGSGVLSPP